MTNCRLCGASEAVPFFVRSMQPRQESNAELLKCSRCGLVYSVQQPPLETLTEQYNQSYYDEVLGSTCADRSPDTVARYFSSLLKQMDPYRRGGRLLDVGCATGDFLMAARNRGWEVTGIEVSKYAAEVARSRGLRVLDGSLDAVWETLDSFDVVTMWEVLEHLSDPLGELLQVRRLLAPGGLLAVSTPNVYGLSTYLFGRQSVIFKPGEHLSYFSRPTLTRTLNDTGFRVLFVRSHLLLLTNFFVAWQRGRPLADRSQPARLSTSQKARYRVLFRLFHGTGVGTMGIKLANRVLNQLGLGDGLVAFAQVAG